MILIAGITPFSWIYRISASLLFCIPIGLIVLSIYVFVTKNIVRDKIDFKLALLVLLYALLASPHIIYQLGTSGYIFILFSTYLIFITQYDKLVLDFCH